MVRWRWLHTTGESKRWGLDGTRDSPRSRVVNFAQTVHELARGINLVLLASETMKDIQPVGEL